MKIWLNTSFKGHYPVGTAAVVVTESARQAAQLLNAALVAGAERLAPTEKPSQFHELPCSEPRVVILRNGDY